MALIVAPQVRKSLAVNSPPMVLAQIIVNLSGVDWTAVAVIVDVLKQLLARQLLAAPHQACQSFVIHDIRAARRLFRETAAGPGRRG